MLCDEQILQCLPTTFLRNQNFDGHYLEAAEGYYSVLNIIIFLLKLYRSYTQFSIKKSMEFSP